MNSPVSRARPLLAAAAACLALGLSATALGAPAGKPGLGLWIECEGRYRTLDDAGRVREAVAAADALGATDLFVQVYRNGTAWFPTRLASDAPFVRARVRGFDPLGLLLELARARGMRVHAWVNLLRVDAGKDSALVRALGERAILGDETGRPLTAEGPWGPNAGFKPDTPGAWLDPGSPPVGERLRGILRDLIAAYPSLDGVHLDYVRYPMPVADQRAPRRAGGAAADLGWSAASREAFLAAAAKDGARPTRERWDRFRRDRLTGLLQALRETVKRGRPGRILSAAVIADPREARERALQDWPAWGRKGLLDLLVPMNYRLDPVAFDALARAGVARRGRAAMFIGIGAWRFGDDVAAIALRVALAREAGAQGAVLFSHDNLRSHPASFDRLGALLAAEVDKPRALPPAAPGGAPLD